MTNASFAADGTPPGGPTPSTPTPAPVSAKEEAVDTVRFLALLAIAVLIFRSFFLSPFNIPSESMQPRLLIGDYLLVNKMAYGYSKYSLPFSAPLIPDRIFARTPERGDVVVFKYPKEPERDFIKRVIGLPGDRLELKQKKVYINDQPIDESYVQFIATPSAPGAALPGDLRENYGPVTVPDGQYFMMGDNRDNSTDSRASWGVGYVPFDNLIGRAEIIFFSAAVDEPDAFRWWSPWTWPFDIRWNRFFKLVR